MRFVDLPEWRADCIRWRGVVLTGYWAHWCWDWDDLPVDETSLEWDCCGCFYHERAGREYQVGPFDPVAWPEIA
ncbi:MAG: hypothetical protein KAX46_07925 [Chromatiaceae bacterium]|nr:hypothetical protein [Chromatiaceae bacterium]